MLLFAVIGRLAISSHRYSVSRSLLITTKVLPVSLVCYLILTAEWPLR